MHLPAFTLPADAQTILAAYAQQCQDELACTSPRSVTRAEWDAALAGQVLLAGSRGPFHAFQATPPDAGRVVDTYLRRGARCWAFRAPVGMGLEAIIETVRRHLAEQNRSAA